MKPISAAESFLAGRVVIGEWDFCWGNRQGETGWGAPRGPPEAWPRWSAASASHDLCRRRCTQILLSGIPCSTARIQPFFLPCRETQCPFSSPSHLTPYLLQGPYPLPRAAPCPPASPAFRLPLEANLPLRTWRACPPPRPIPLWPGLWPGLLRLSASCREAPCREAPCR